MPEALSAPVEAAVESDHGGSQMHWLAYKQLWYTQIYLRSN